MTAAGWYEDPNDGERFRYWDGAAWTDKRKPAAVALAAQQTDLIRRMANDVRSLKAMLTFVVVVIALGLVGEILLAFVK